MPTGIPGDFFANYPVHTCVMAFILGLGVGSFLNVLALRSLKEESILWPPSNCATCNHRLALWDNIPLLSYFLLWGRCRYCKQKISWQYPLVELITGLAFLAIAQVFLVNPLPLDPQFLIGNCDLFAAIHGGMLNQTFLSSGMESFPPLKIALALGMVALASTLIAVTVTDFREKLIPHEITYPSMIFGLLFSAFVRKDLLGAMAGIGASYIIFDFLAFYGLKLYMAMHKDDLLEETQDEPVDDELDRTFELQKVSPDEPVEVMGGGDAVLSAVMAAYLGWQMLVVSLVIGFFAGTIMGLTLLLIDMSKSGLLKDGAKRALFWALIAAIFFGGMTYVTQTILLQPISSFANFYSAGLMAALSAFAAALLGIISVGTKVSKPFPFGPALALGGFIAIFLIPYWLPFY